MTDKATIQEHQAPLAKEPVSQGVCQVTMAVIAFKEHRLQMVMSQLRQELSLQQRGLRVRQRQEGP